MSWLVSLGAGVLAAMLVPPLVLKLSRVAQPAVTEGEWRVAQYSGGLSGCASFCGLLFLGLSAFAYTHPGRTPPGQMLPALALFVFFGVMGFYSAWQMGRARILWNDQEIRSRGISIRWQDLQGATFLGWAQAFRLSDGQGRGIWVYQTMTGFPELWQKVEEYLSPT